MRMCKTGDEERGCGFLRFLSPSRSSLFLLCAVKKIDSAGTHSTLRMPVESRLADANVLSEPVLSVPHYASASVPHYPCIRASSLRSACGGLGCGYFLVSWAPLQWSHRWPIKKGLSECPDVGGLVSVTTRECNHVRVALNTREQSRHDS